MSDKNREQDKEISTLRLVAEVLAELNPDEARRVIGWMIDRHGANKQTAICPDCHCRVEVK